MDEVRSLGDMRRSKVASEITCSRVYASSYVQRLPLAEERRDIVGRGDALVIGSSLRLTFQPIPIDYRCDPAI